MPAEQDTDRTTGWRAKELNASDLLSLLMALSALGLAVFLVLGTLSLASPGVRASLSQGIARVPFEVRWNVVPRPAAVPVAGQRRLVGFDTVVLSDSHAGLTIADSLQMLAVGSVGLFFLYHLRRLVWTIEQGQPFEAGNGGHLRRMAGAMIAAGILSDAWQFVGIEHRLQEVGDAVRSLIPTANVGYQAHVSWQLYLGAFVVFALAHAFEMGTRLQRDHDLTV